MENYTDINVQIELDQTHNKVTVIENGSEQIVEGVVSNEDFNEIQQAMQVPGFGLGFVLIKIGKAINKALGGGSSAS